MLAIFIFLYNVLFLGAYMYKFIVFSCLCLFTFTSCGVSQKHWKTVEAMMARRQLAEADAFVSQAKEKEYGKRNGVLYYLDKGAILHDAGKYPESIASFDKAEVMIEDLFTKSISQEAASLTTNDNLRPYVGEDFEQALVPLFNALNFAYQGNWENALVEGRKVDHKLQVLSDKYEQANKKRKANEQPVKVVYTEDAFVRYFMGILFEAQGEVNDAFIFYRKAFETYQTYLQYYKTPMPPTLGQDLLRTTEDLGFREEHEEYRNKFPNTKWISERELKKKSQLVVVFENGFAPFKKEISLDIPNPLRMYDRLKVALPEFSPRRPAVRYAQVVLNDGKVRDRTYLTEDITEIASRNLKDRYPAIIGRAIARLVIKEGTKAGASKLSEKKGGAGIAGSILYVGTSVAAYATERADLRSWRILPAEVQLSRTFLEPGTYNVRLQFMSDFGGIIDEADIGSVSLKAGQTRFVGYRHYH